MDLLDFVLNPGVAVGCVIGIGAASLLQWLFPSKDLVLVQGLLIVFFAVVGMIVQFTAGDGRKDKAP